MILSLPNSGTDWLCRILAKHGKDLRYYEKEFFNPLCNWKHCLVMELAFGCEMVSCHRNIGLCAEEQADQLEAIYQNTWCQYDWNFDKENFAAFKVDFFAKHFEIVILHRSAGSMFPPSRARVWNWYDAIWNGLVAHGHLIGHSMALECRAHDAHRVCSWELVRWADRLGAPVLDYDVLCTAPVGLVQDHLDRGWIGRAVDVQAAAAEMVAGRRQSVKSAGDYLASR